MPHVHQVTFTNFHRAAQNAGENAQVLLGAVLVFLLAILVWLIMDATVGCWYDRTYRRK
jgi:ABC-type proline/glycine betaine transport system permease subunit